MRLIKFLKWAWPTNRKNLILFVLALIGNSWVIYNAFTDGFGLANPVAYVVMLIPTCGFNIGIIAIPISIYRKSSR